MKRSSAEPHVGELPGPNAREWVEYHQQFAAPSTYVREFVWDVTEDAAGPFCTDVDGNILMDFATHVAAAPLGYNNPHLFDRMSEFDLVDPLKIAGQDFYVGAGPSPTDSAFPGPAHLMNRLTELTSHYDMDTVFLSNSGAEAVENAMKICYDHCESPKYGITFEGAFHGRTLGALSLNRSKEIYRRKFPELASITEFEYSVGGVERLSRNLEKKHGFLNPAEVAFIIIEPIQGEGGYRIPSDELMEKLETVRSEHQIPVIADEIQSGLSRTGERWGADHYALTPDVITSAKALRVGATVGNSDMFPSETGRLSSTWGAGDILSSAIGALTLDVIEDQNLRQNATRRGRQFKEQIHDTDLPGVVDVRGRGLMLAIEVESADYRDAILTEAFRRGLILLGCGERTIRVLPPLDVREREINIATDLIAQAVRAVSPVVG